MNERSSENAGNALISPIFNCIRDRSVSTALDFLEKRGVTGDVAIFILANLQNLEVF